MPSLVFPIFKMCISSIERGDLTDSGSTHVSIIRDLAQEVNAMGKTARCSFAGEYQMANADPCLYDCLKPAFNIYPSLSFKDGRSTPTDDFGEVDG